MKITRRTAERLIRAGHEYDDLAATMRAEGHLEEGDLLESLGARLNGLGHELMTKLEGAR